eukprot:scaffold10472_cov126-Cylindrotheca_fusiformis.AAC.5
MDFYVPCAAQIVDTIRWVDLRNAKDLCEGWIAWLIVADTAVDTGHGRCFCGNMYDFRNGGGLRGSQALHATVCAGGSPGS